MYTYHGYFSSVHKSAFAHVMMDVIGDGRIYPLIGEYPERFFTPACCSMNLRYEIWNLSSLIILQES